MRVLVVDDQSTLRRILVKIVEKVSVDSAYVVKPFTAEAMTQRSVPRRRIAGLPPIDTHDTITIGKVMRAAGWVP